jgi:hypothetical protein
MGACGGVVRSSEESRVDYPTANRRGVSARARKARFGAVNCGEGWRDCWAWRRWRARLLRAVRDVVAKRRLAAAVLKTLARVMRPPGSRRRYGDGGVSGGAVASYRTPGSACGASFRRTAGSAIPHARGQVGEGSPPRRTQEPRPPQRTRKARPPRRTRTPRPPRRTQTPRPPRRAQKPRFGPVNCGEGWRGCWWKERRRDEATSRTWPALWRGGGERPHSGNCV